MDDKSQRRGEPNSKEITLRIYHHADGYKDYLSARFYPNTGRSRVSFEWEGHRWAYRHTHFDDQGDYDLIYRPAPQPAEPVNYVMSEDEVYEALYDVAVSHIDSNGISVIEPDILGPLIRVLAVAVTDEAGFSPQPAEPAEPWYGHKYKEYPDGTWRCADGCGPILVAQPAASVEPAKGEPLSPDFVIRTTQWGNRNEI